MRLLFHHRIASRDGQSVHMDELIEALGDLGHEVIVVGPSRTARIDFGGDVAFIAALKRTLPRGVYELLEFAYSFAAFWRLRRAIRAYRPDAIYERFNLFMLAGIWVRRLYGVPLLLEVNAPLFEERAAHDGIALPRLAAWTQRATWRGADYVLPVTRVLARHVRAAGVADERIIVIPNGINPRRFAGVAEKAEAKERLGLDGRLVLGFTGFIRAWHGLDRVIDLLADIGRRFDLHLLIVGDGPTSDLERQAQARGVAERLTITGTVGRDDIALYIAAFEVALQPGVTAYASPLKLFEYMAVGRAIVAPDAENIREILTDGIDALLFDPGHPGSFTEAIERLCDDPELRLRIGKAAQAAIGEKGLTWKSNAERISALVEQLTAGQPAPGSEPARQRSILGHAGADQPLSDARAGARASTRYEADR